MASHKREALIAGRDVLLGIGILVEAEKVSFVGEVLEDFLTVSAATESDIYVRAIGAQIHRVQAFGKHHGNVIAIYFLRFFHLVCKISAFRRLAEIKKQDFLRNILALLFCPVEG
jgi:hypothetical protein